MPPSTADQLPTEAGSHRTTSQAAALRRTSDTHRVIKGRRWRLTDPALDGPTRQHLVNELMHARRAVKAALATNDSALGERGPKWWEPMTSDDVELRVGAFVRTIGNRLGDIDERQATTLLLLQT